MRNAVTMAIKDLVLLWRDRFGMFWILVFPLVMATFFGAIFGGGGDGVSGMRIAVVDRDGTDGSRAFIESLDDSEALQVVRTDGEGAPLDVGAARDAVRRGAVVAYVMIPAGFGEAGLAMFGGQAPQIEVGIDPARKAEAGYLEGLLMEASFQRLQELFSDPAAVQTDVQELSAEVETDPGLTEAQRSSLSSFLGSLEGFMGDLDGPEFGSDGADDGVAIQPPQIRTQRVVREGARPPTPWAISFPQAMVWGLLGCTAGFAVSLVQERTRGTWLRLRVAPQSDTAILAGKGLACFSACAGVIALLFVVGSFFGVRASLPALAVAASATAFCFTGMMMVISTLGRTERAVAGAGWAAMMPFAMTGGGMIPLILMPGWMRSISHLSPVKWAVTAVEGATWRGFSAGEMMLPVGVLLGVGLATFAVGVWRMRSWSAG